MAVLQVFQAKLLRSMDESNLNPAAFSELRIASDLASVSEKMEFPLASYDAVLVSIQVRLSSIKTIIPHKDRKPDVCMYVCCICKLCIIVYNDITNN